MEFDTHRGDELRLGTDTKQLELANITQVVHVKTGAR